MTLPVLLTRNAEADVVEAHAWYAARGRSLGEGFDVAFADCMASIARHPESYALLHRFPYCVFYVLEPGRVVVHGCFHARRDPRTWMGRQAPA